MCNIPGPIPVLSIYINPPETNVKTTKLSSLRWKSLSKRIAWFFRIDVHVSLDFLLLISMGIHGCSWICSMDLHGFSIDVRGFSWCPNRINLKGKKKTAPRCDRCLATRAWYRGSRATSEGRPGHCYTQCCPPDFSKGKGADAFMMMNRIFCDCSGLFGGFDGI